MWSLSIAGRPDAVATGSYAVCYSREEVDLVAGYCTDTERCYALSPDMFEGHAAISLRLSPTRNNQLVGVNWARDFEFERLDWSTLGAIAQLGERDAGSVEVAGSSPAGSINHLRSA